MSAITCKQAHARGITRQQLISGDYRRLFHGVYIPSSEPVTLPTLVAAARLVLPSGSVATSWTALQLAGLDFGPRSPLWFATPPPRCDTVRDGIRVVRRASLADAQPVDPVPTALHELLRHESPIDALCVTERLMHLGILSSNDLDRLRDQATRRQRVVLRDVERGAESVRETIVRMVLNWAGLPHVECNVDIGAGDTWIARVDLVYRLFGVIVEYEGRQHLNDRVQWQRDIERTEQLSAAGFTVIRVTAEHLHDPWTVVTRVEDALRARGYRGARARQTPKWRAAFG